MDFTEIHWAQLSGYPILGLLQLLPFATMLLILGLRKRKVVFPVGVAAALLELLLALWLYHLYEPARAAMQFAEQFPLFGPFAYHAAADGVTVLFVLLNAVLTLMVVFYSQIRALPSLSRILAMVFAVEAALMSMLVTVDLFWFVLMSAIQLLPVGYLIWRWATSPEKDLALTRFLQFMGTSVLLMLAGTLMLGWNYADATGAGWTFDLFKLAEVEIPVALHSVVFFLLFYGLAIRTPLFPFHGWLPVLAEHGSIAVAPVFLLGLKIGLYGLLRFVFPLMPEAVLQWHPYVVSFAVAGIFYAALLALLQENLRRLLAFAVVSHTSMLVIGLFSLGRMAFQGSVMLSINFGLAITGLLFMSGMVYKRTNTMLLYRLGGLFDHIPLISITFLVSALAIVGMPGTPGFDAVHLVLEDSMHRFGALVTIAAALGNVLAAGFLLLAFQRAFLQGRTGEQNRAGVECASPLERLVAVMLLMVLLGTGFFSEPWLELTEQSLTRLSAIFVTSAGH